MLPSLDSHDLQTVRTYIKQTWTTLTRTTADTLNAAQDTKVDHVEGSPWPVYISPGENLEQVRAQLQQVLLPDDFQQIELRILPAEIDQIKDHGLLYLPHDYVVPGGRFNEMYGWDSFFIQLGLLHDGELALSKSLTDQLLYEIEHYGTILNANRTYLLTRSQPPFLTPMILNVFRQTQDHQWLRSTLPTAERYYYFWTVPPHLNQATGLSHYFDLGDGPAPEVIFSERDEQGRTHYDRIRQYYSTHPVTDYDVTLYYDQKYDRLTDLFYKGDRAMRESGLDPSNRFGPFSIDIIHYAPVCLNVLLYRMEQDLAEINALLGHDDSVQSWCDRAETRQRLINHFLWDEDAGLYFDYNFREGGRRVYPYLSTFYPLWAGVASKEQAARVVQNLPQFEAAGGLRASTVVTGNQWDAPFGWAPLIWVAVEGLRRYGYQVECDRIARKFINLLVQDFKRSGTLLEKYDVDTCSGDVSGEIEFGYSTNEVGFGWTNGVFLDLLSKL